MKSKSKITDEKIQNHLPRNADHLQVLSGGETDRGAPEWRKKRMVYQSEQ